MQTTAGNAVLCRWCGRLHSVDGRCPEVKAMEFNPDGTVKRVEFYSPNDYAPHLGSVEWGWRPKPNDDPNRFRTTIS